MIEVTKIDRFVMDLAKYRIEDGVLLRESVQLGLKISQLVVPEKFHTNMVSFLMHFLLPKDTRLRTYHDDLRYHGCARTLSLVTHAYYAVVSDSTGFSLFFSCLGVSLV